MLSGLPMKMRKPLRISIIVAVVAIVCQFAWLMSGPREPAYKGKRLSYWISRYDSLILGKIRTRSSDQQEADKAVREIGTDALPYLLKLAGRKDTALKERFLSIYRRQSWLKLPIHDAQFYRIQAACGFSALREKAKPAVPKIIPLLKDQDLDVRAAAANDLAMIGPEAEEAIPALFPLLDEQNHGTPILEAMMALGAIHRRPDSIRNWRGCGSFEREAKLERDPPLKAKPQVVRGMPEVIGRREASPTNYFAANSVGNGTAF